MAARPDRPLPITVNDRYGYLQVTEKIGNTYRVRCACGVVKVLDGTSVKRRRACSVKCPRLPI